MTNRYADTCLLCGQPVPAGQGELVLSQDSRQCNVPAHWRRGQCWHVRHPFAPASVIATHKATEALCRPRPLVRV
jgi:hypothetical protein